MHIRKHFIVPALVLVPAIAASGAVAETTIGRWCDRMIPSMPKYNRILEVVVTNSGGVEVRSNLNDGSPLTNDLREVAGNMYEVVGSTSGEKYRILSNDGNLQLIDEDGIIRVASRLENKRQSGECAK